MKYLVMAVFIFVYGNAKSQVSIETNVYIDTIKGLVQIDSQITYLRIPDSTFFFHFQNIKILYLEGGNIESESEQITFGEDLETINSFLKTYYKNGQVKSIQYYINGNLYGPCVSYYENGIVDSIGFYWTDSINPHRIRNTIRCDTIIDEEIGIFITCIQEMISVKDQIWEYFNYNGQLVKKEYWNKGMLLSRELY
jgi:antitoxin component YwqK of YwqJK toxin-antitoxin module